MNAERSPKNMGSHGVPITTVAIVSVPAFWDTRFRDFRHALCGLSRRTFRADCVLAIAAADRSSYVLSKLFSVGAGRPVMGRIVPHAFGQVLTTTLTKPRSGHRIRLGHGKD